MRKILIANFKMNTTPSAFKSYAMTLATKAKHCKNEIIVCPPYTHLFVARDMLAGTNVSFGAQNLSEEEKGELTGEISASMIKDLGANYVVVGHCERRLKFKENDKTINKKIKTALANGLKVILCVGENLQTRTNKQACQFVRNQLEEDLRGIYENELEGVIVAYEPVWAFGTGKNVTAKDIAKMVETIRKEIAYMYSDKAGNTVNVVYGGGVTLSNYKKLLDNDELNGLLVGNACLDVDNFAIMCKENY